MKRFSFAILLVTACKSEPAPVVTEAAAAAAPVVTEEAHTCVMHEETAEHHAPNPDAPGSFATRPAIGTKATCVVMDQLFTIQADTPIAEHAGRHYPFCCDGCRKQFADNPEKFAALAR